MSLEKAIRFANESRDFPAAAAGKIPPLGLRTWLMLNAIYELLLEENELRRSGR